MQLRAMLIGYRSGLHTDEELGVALDMATHASAAAIGKSGYGLAVGNDASFVVLPAINACAAVAGVPGPRRVVWKGQFRKHTTFTRCARVNGNRQPTQLFALSAGAINPAPKQLRRQLFSTHLKNQSRRMSALDFKALRGRWPRRSRLRVLALLTRHEGIFMPG